MLGFTILILWSPKEYMMHYSAKKKHHALGKLVLRCFCLPVPQTLVSGTATEVRDEQGSLVLA